MCEPLDFECRLQEIEQNLSVHIPPQRGLLHGIEHLRQVALLAGRIAAESGADGADVEAAMVAGFLHDIARRGDFNGSWHAAASAELARPLLVRFYPHLDIDKICGAIAQHANGLTSDDPLIGALWDADRLELRRMGRYVRKDLLSTKVGKRILQEACR